MDKAFSFSTAKKVSEVPVLQQLRYLQNALFRNKLFNENVENRSLQRICLAFLLVIVTACSASNQQKDYEWGVISGEIPFTNRHSDKNVGLETEYVKSKLHPDLHTAFYLHDGKWLRTLDGYSGSWMGGTNVLGGNSFSQPLPEKLHLVYFSLFENQFYQLDATLPTAEIEKNTEFKKSRNVSTP